MRVDQKRRMESNWRQHYRNLPYPTFNVKHFI
nr:MAG TPA: protein of unknown function (DUF5453) [Caudoviricetes sp.]